MRDRLRFRKVVRPIVIAAGTLALIYSGLEGAGSVLTDSLVLIGAITVGFNLTRLWPAGG
jgi:hypothetical protein